MEVGRAAVAVEQAIVVAAVDLHVLELDSGTAADHYVEAAVLAAFRIVVILRLGDGDESDGRICLGLGNETYVERRTCIGEKPHPAGKLVAEIQVDGDVHIMLIGP